MKNSLLIKLLIGVCVGFIIGLFSNNLIIQAIVIIKEILSQIIFFTIPLIIIGFIAPSIANITNNATKQLNYSIIIAYLSTIGAATLSMLLGYVIVPLITIEQNTTTLKSLPSLLFTLEINPIMPVMSALVLAIMIGLAVSKTKSVLFKKGLNELQIIVLKIIQSFIIPLLPIYISCTFATLSYQGTLTKQLPLFFIIILLAILLQFIWLIILYTIASIYSKQNPIEVLKHYVPAYFSAFGTMSSAATLPISIQCANKSKILNKQAIDFGIPLFSNIHLCGSVLTEVLFILAVSNTLYNSLPNLNTMILFILLLGIFGIGAPGVPGGVVMASLGLITSILGFTSEGTALIMTIFALQDSFGTACNVVGDGALTLMLSTYINKKR